MKPNYSLLEVSEDNLGLKNIKIHELALINSKNYEVIIYFELLKLNDGVFEDIEKITNILLKLKDDIKIEFEILNKSYSEKFSDEEIVKFAITYLKSIDVLFGSQLPKVSFKLVDNTINIKSRGIFPMSSQIIEQNSKKIYRFLNEKFSLRYNVNIKYMVEDQVEEVEFKSDDNIVKEYKLDIKAPEVKKSGIEVKNKVRYTKMNVSSFKELEDIIVGQEIALRGEIFYMDLFTTKNGKVRVSIYITDNINSSIACTKFVNSIEEIQFKLGDIVEVQGKYNKYFDDYSLVLSKIEIVENGKEKRVDNSEIKRIELAAHTNMSEMTSTIDSKELISIAKGFGHKAVAVTDYGVVHAFPFLAKHVKMDEDFKIIYGIEAYVVDDEASLVKNPKDIYMNEEEFVVFDIETTGFSAINDKIIEIGAVKLKAGKVVSKFSEFVNPEMPIPQKIIELTSINDNMVKDAETIENVMPRFLDFVKDCTLVAHNAKFDVGFITKKCEQLGYTDTDFSVIDTLEWAKTLIPDVNKYSLDHLSKKFNIQLESHHRAVDDAAATAELFKILMKYMSSLGVEKLTDITIKVQKEIKKADTENVNILVKNVNGLKRLYELVSNAHLYHYGDKKPRILKSEINSDRDNLLISSSPVYSGRFNKGKLVDLYIRGMSKSEILDAMDFYDYVQVYPESIYADSIYTEEISGFEFIQKMNKEMVEMAKEKNKIVVATGNVYYADKKDKKARSALALGSEKAYRTYDIDTSNYFRTTEEMLDEFDYLGKDRDDVVIYNTYKIADQIEKIKPIPDGEYRPVMEGAEEEVESMSYNKAYELYGNPLPDVVRERIEKELNSIIGNGFAVLYLIAQKLVKKSVDNGYLVGSRGSVGSSLVAYLMGITEVNGLYPHYRCPECKYFDIKDFEGAGVDLEPAKCPNCNHELVRDGHSIPFEVFMGFKGDKTPDIDLNFSGEYQGEIHKYTKELFGDDFVFRAGTISTLAEKNAFGIAKKYFEENIKRNFEKDIQNKYGNTLKKLDADLRGLEESNLLKMTDEYCSRNKAEITRVSKGCEGARKTTGQHPGGMIVVPNYKSIYDFSPVQYPANDENSGSIITHFDYHVMDQQLVKLDILGHDDPTTLRMLQDLTDVDIYTIPLTDPKVISLFSSTEALGVSPEQIGTKLGTNGIPEFGTDFVKKMLEDTMPKTFAELVRISGLSHGTDVWLNNAEEYVKQGVATLSQVITVRDDIMNHLIDMKMDKSEAFNIMEFVRKGQPSKNKEKWAEYKQKMKDAHIKEWYIESCEKIKYMFPKGHAAAYVMMAVRIAYFKVYYPLEFYTAFLNRKYEDFSFKDMRGSIEELKTNLAAKRALDNIKVLDKKQIILYEILIEMRYRGIDLLPIDIYKSEAVTFKIEDGKIRIPLVAMDQLGEVVAKTIVSERNQNEFSSIEDLTKRCKISKTVLEMLKTYGCIPDTLSESDQLSLF